MAAEVVRALIVATLAASAAILLVRVVRSPLRWMAGARAAYWLWLLVPVLTVAVLLPAPAQRLLPAGVALPAQVQMLLTGAVGDSAASPAPWAAIALALWVVGAAAMFAAMFARQRAFSRSLGEPVRDARGLCRADVPGPMLVGLWNSRIFIPPDFESRYSPEEQALVLAHERAHASRGDVAVSAGASCALCLCWFNPLAYRALAWLRQDQELACDALVLAGRAGARRAYASALLKTQLAADCAWRMPVGCHWQSNHPLKERILMLKRPLPGSSRRFAGIAIVLGIAAASGYAAWAGQSPAAGKGPPILVDLKVTVTNTQSNDVRVLATRYLVRSGEDIRDASSQPLKYACTPYLPDEPGRGTDWRAIRARGIPLPPAGHILVLCSIREDGREIASPAVMMADGQQGAIETSQKDGPLHYRLEISASTSAARIAEAGRQASAAHP